MEIVKKGCQTSEACGEPTKEPSYAGRCTSGGSEREQGMYVRCVKCDDVTEGTCPPDDATSSPIAAGEEFNPIQHSDIYLLLVPLNVI